VLDTEAPSLEIGEVAIDNLITPAEAAAGVSIEGSSSAEDGDTVTVSWGSLRKEAQVSQGLWSVLFEPQELPEAGPSTVSAEVTDRAGNFFVAIDRNVELEVVQPPEPLALDFDDPVADDNTVNDTEKKAGVTVSGTTNAPEGSQVQVYWVHEQNGLEPTTYFADVNDGAWSVTFLPEDVPSDGEYLLYAEIRDEQNNPVVLNTLQVTVDTSAPEALLQVEPPHSLGQRLA
jgi:hypothetical protein